MGGGGGEGRGESQKSKILRYSQTSITDTKGTGISVCIIECPF